MAQYNDFNFAQRAYTINQAYGLGYSNVFPSQLNIKIGQLVNGHQTSGIGIADSFYADWYSNNSMKYTLGNLSHYANNVPAAHQPTAVLIATDPGPAVPRIDFTNLGIFGGTCYPAALGNTTSHQVSRTNSDLKFVTFGAGASSNKYELQLWGIDVNTNTPQYQTGFAIIPPFTNGSPSTANCRIFAVEGYNDGNLMLNGGDPNLHYFTIFIVEYNPGQAIYDWYVETYIYDANINIVGSAYNSAFQSQQNLGVYSGKHDILYPSLSDANATAVRHLIINPKGSSNVYSFDIMTGTNLAQLTTGQAVAYVESLDVIVVADETVVPGFPNGSFKVYNKMLLMVHQYAIQQQSLRFFDGHWHKIGNYVPPSNPNANSVCYFGDFGIAATSGKYRGFAVFLDQNGMVDSVTFNDEATSNDWYIPFNRIMVSGHNSTVWSVGPNYSTYPLYRMVHDKEWYKSSIWAPYTTDSYNEDFTMTYHPDCMDYTGQLGAYSTGYRSGLPGGAGNGHPITTSYNNSTTIHSQNYLVRSQYFPNSVVYSNHHNYILYLGAADNPNNPAGSESYYYISLTGNGGGIGGTSGSYQINGFWGP